MYFKIHLMSILFNSSSKPVLTFDVAISRAMETTVIIQTTVIIINVPSKHFMYTTWSLEVVYKAISMVEKNILHATKHCQKGVPSQNGRHFICMTCIRK